MALLNLVPQGGSQKSKGASALGSQRGLLPKGEASAKGVSPMSDWRPALPTCTPTGKQATRSVSDRRSNWRSKVKSIMEWAF